MRPSPNYDQARTPFRGISILGVLQMFVLLGFWLPPLQRCEAQSLVKREWSIGGNTEAMAVDAQGAIVAVGSIGTIKFAADHTVLWQHSPSFFRGAAVVSDSAGDVYAAGMIDAGAGRSELFIAKYAGSVGTVVWEQRHPLSTRLKVAAIAVDSQGNVGVAGSLGDVFSTTKSDLYTAKYSGADGSLIWFRTYDGPGHRDDEAAGICMDQAGDVFVAGTVPQAPDVAYPPTSVHTTKYRGSDGKIVWEQDVLYSECTGIALDAPGDLIMVASSSRAVTGIYSFDHDYYTVKYDGSDGHILWDQRVESPSEDFARAMAVNSAGDIFVTGYLGGQYNRDIYTVKYSGVNGGLIWENRYDGPLGAEGEKNDEAYVLALDSSGDVFIGGRSADIDMLQRGGDYYFAKYSSSDGSLLWQHRIGAGYSTPLPIDDLKSIPSGGVISRLGSSFTTFFHPADPVSEVVHASGDPLEKSGFHVVELRDLPYQGAVWATFSTPTIDDLGRIACRARWKSPDGGRTAFLLGDRTIAFQPPGDYPRPRFISPMDPVQNDAGYTGFLAKYSGTGVNDSNDSIAVLNDVVAREGSPAPDRGLWESFSNIAVTGNVTGGDLSLFLEGRLQFGSGIDPRNDTVLCVAAQTGPFSFSELAVVLREGVSLGGLGPRETVKSWKLLYSPEHSPGQSAALVVGNRPIFIASLSSGRKAILTIEGTAARVLLVTDDPTGSAELPGSIWTSFNSLATGKDSLVLLGTAQTSDGAQVTGVFTSDRDAQEWEPLALLEGEIPGLKGISLKAIDSPVVSPLLSERVSGIAFSATLSGTGISRGNDHAIVWIRTGAELTILAQEGLPAAEWNGAVWRDFESIAMPGGGFGPLFRASVTEKGSKESEAVLRRGVWTVDSRGALRLLFRQGDKIEGKVVSAFSCLSAVRGSAGDNRAFNNLGEVTWHATFTDRSEAVLRTTIP